MGKGTLYYFTSEYPYGSGESFVSNELEVLSTCYDTIYVCPLYKRNSARKLPANVVCVDDFAMTTSPAKGMIVRCFFSFSSILIGGWIHSKNKAAYLFSLREQGSRLLQNFSRAEKLKFFLKTRKESVNVFYTFWFNDWATTLAILKSQQTIPKFYSRAHGFDVYEERSKNGFIPFRYFQLHSVERVFSISQNGKQYLQDHYPVFSNKLDVLHLGVNDHGTNPFDANINTIVSCSRAIPLKRLHLIAGMLNFIKARPVTWIHIGDGPELESIKQLTAALPQHVRVKFTGNLQPSQINEVYATQPISCFINVSETEGIPVSMMEAISFGIPILATNVGGVAEIVNEQTGKLVSDQISEMELAAHVDAFLAGHFNTADARTMVRESWANSFNARENYKALCAQLTN